MKKATRDLLLAGAALFVGSKLLKKKEQVSQEQVSQYTTDLSQDKITGLGAVKSKEEEEEDKILEFIDDWENKNPYKRSEVAKYNAKFRKDFMRFAKKNKIKDASSYLSYI